MFKYLLFEAPDHMQHTRIFDGNADHKQMADSTLRDHPRWKLISAGQFYCEIRSCQHKSVTLDMPYSATASADAETAVQQLYRSF